MLSLKERLTEILINNKLITQEQLNTAIEAQREKGGKLSNIIVDLKFIKESELISTISKGLGLPLIDLKRFKIDYEIVKECAAADKRIGRTHLDVFHKGYRGYGGKCLPKDTRALIQKGDELGVDLKLLKITEKINSELIKQDEQAKDR